MPRDVLDEFKAPRQITTLTGIDHTNHPAHNHIKTITDMKRKRLDSPIVEADLNRLGMEMFGFKIVTKARVAIEY